MEPFLGCFPRGPPHLGFFLVPISYMGVGGYKYSVNFGTQKTPILGGHILAFYHSIGVDIILGGGGTPGGYPILRSIWGGIEFTIGTR